MNVACIAIHIYVCMHACVVYSVYVCAYVCMYVCTHAWEMYFILHAHSDRVCVCVCIHTHTHTINTCMDGVFHLACSCRSRVCMCVHTHPHTYYHTHAWMVYFILHALADRVCVYVSAHIPTQTLSYTNSLHYFPVHQCLNIILRVDKGGKRRSRTEEIP